MKDSIQCLAAYFGVTPGEVLGALGSVGGGIIGALGVAGAVFLTLNRQRKDERDKIYEALRTEVMEFCRLVVGHLETCRNIKGGLVIGKADFPSLMRMPRPIIYPAAADRIGRIREGHRIVRFYARMAEVEQLAMIIATQPLPFVQDVTLIAYAWMDVCEFGKRFLEGKPAEPNFKVEAERQLFSDIDEAVRETAEMFPSP